MNMISVEEARAEVLAHCGETPVTRLPLADAAGRILRETLHADRDFPPCDRVMMDGYALRFADVDATGGKFRITGFCPAGAEPMRLPAESGACIEIGTGAVLPEGADCILPYELTSREADRVLLLEAAKPEAGVFIHRKGSDAQAGERLITPGVRIGAPEIAIAASIGKEKLTVSERPRIGIFATGDELVDIAHKPAPHQVRASNPPTLVAACAGAGYPVETLQRLPDRAAVMKTALERAFSDHEVLVTIGSVSKGKTDFLPDVLHSLHCTRRFHGVRQKPGKPLGFWTGPDGQLIFTLPGNPVSCLAACAIHLVPALNARTGLRAAPPDRRPLAEPVDFSPALTWFCPAILRDGTATACPPANSGDFLHLQGTDGLLEFRSENASAFPAGTLLPFHPWPGASRLSR